MNQIAKSIAFAMGLAAGGAASAADIKDVTIEQVRNAAANACEGGKSYQVAYSHSVSEVAIVKQVRRFANERAADLGCVTVLHDNTQANNLEQQINAIQGWITLVVS